MTYQEQKLITVLDKLLLASLGNQSMTEAQEQAARVLNYDNIRHYIVERFKKKDESESVPE